MARTFKLNDLQLILLATAAQRDDGSLLPPPERLHDQGARIRKAVPPLLKHALVEEAPTSDAASSWRQDGDTLLGLLITAAGRAMISVDEASGSDMDAAEEEATVSDVVETEPVADAPPASSALPEPTRPTSKIALVTELLIRADGASLEELVTATGWLPHTTRAALTGLRKKGHAVTRSGKPGATRYLLAAL